MEIDLIGRVSNTRLSASNCLLPLFEALINSIHALEGRSDGVIEIFLERDIRQNALGDGPVSEPVVGFRVVDNGAGFTEANFRSFNTTDSRQKAIAGGKGIGRLLWLKAFEGAEVTSTYIEQGTTYHREFLFAPTDKGVERHTHSTANAPTSSPQTTIRLFGFRPPYREKCPRSADIVAKRIIDHCLEFFVLGACPTIRLHDTANNNVLVLNEMFSSDVQSRSAAETFKIKDHEFKITHLCVSSTPSSEHRLNFCAHRRTVISEPLAEEIPNLEVMLRNPEGGQPFVYVGYVSSPYLDGAVVADRTAFETVERDELDFGQVAWDELVETSVRRSAEFLAPYTDRIQSAKMDRIRMYVQYRAPEYRPLLRHRISELEKIPNNLTDEKLDLELYKIGQDWESELRGRYQALLAEQDKAALDHAAYQGHVESFLEAWNESGMSKLARHVAHRRATLQFLESRLRLREEGKYYLEEAIHKVIFPLRTTSDDVPAEQMNLWILDERLAYHYYLASDKRLDQLDPVNVESQLRPDLVVFNAPSAFVDSEPGFSSVVLVEFKRPAREEYDDEDNPVSQIYRYVRSIRDGTQRDRHGRPIIVPLHTPFYAHIVCDLTEKVRRYAEDSGLTSTPDSHGYFGFNQTLRVYVEVMSYDKLLGDARKRNAILFDKLGLGK